MDGLHGRDPEMHITDAEQQMHVHYMHDQNHGMHHLSNGNGMEDDHDDGGAVGGDGMRGELHSDPGAVSDSPMMAAGADNNQLTLSFQGQVYVFDSVSPEKASLYSFFHTCYFFHMLFSLCKLLFSTAYSRFGLS